jgi:transposase
MKERRRFDKQFKIDAVRLLESSDKTATALAAELGIPGNALSRWRRELNEDNVVAFTGHGNPRDEELSRLRKENADLKMERDILKKAMAIFSRPESRNTNS